MKKNNFKIIIFVFFILIFFFVLKYKNFSYQILNQKNISNFTNKLGHKFRTINFDHKIKINNTIFDANFANTEILRNKGFSDVKEINENQAILFIFDQPSMQTFWMKDMNFDLDILWIDENNKIIKIDKNISKNSYNKNNPALSEILHSPAPVKYVLEIKAGVSEKNKINIGDEIKTFK
jgi:uncharacterized membrane protein (UPF0127 family)